VAMLWMRSRRSSRLLRMKRRDCGWGVSFCGLIGRRVSQYSTEKGF